MTARKTGVCITLSKECIEFLDKRDVSQYPSASSYIDDLIRKEMKSTDASESVFIRKRMENITRNISELHDEYSYLSLQAEIALQKESEELVNVKGEISTERQRKADEKLRLNQEMETWKANRKRDLESIFAESAQTFLDQFKTNPELINDKKWVMAACDEMGTYGKFGPRAFVEWLQLKVES